MTYREAVQIQIQALQVIYDNAEGLRDAATEKEKDAWNLLRKNLRPLWGALQKVDNEMSDSRAAYQLKGNYKVVANL